jgi:hypothetical protein
MEEWIAQLLGAGVGIFLATMWVQFALRPDYHMNLYFREPINTPAGRNEIRSMIGGTNLGLGCLMFLSVVLPEYRKAFFLAVGVVGFAIGGTRLAFLSVDRPHTNFNRLDAVVEPFGGLALMLVSQYLL